MSNYTENFTSTNGDVIDATELEFEFDAIATAIATKLDSDGTGTMTGDLAMGANSITGVADPSNAQDASTKNYVDARHAVQATVATTSGTSAAFTGIPSTAKHLIVTLAGVSMSSVSSRLLLQIGPTGGLETSGYISYATNLLQSAEITTVTTGFYPITSNAAASLFQGQIHVVKMSDDVWQFTSNLLVNTSGTAAGFVAAGSKSLAAPLTQIDLQCVTAGTYDLGTVGLMVYL